MSELLLSPQDEHLRKDFYLDTHGYYRSRIAYYDGTKKRRQAYIHRVILKPKTGEYIDHINRNPADNRRENLRVASQSLNLHNQPRKGKYKKGVYFDNWGKRFRACISVKNKTIKLGSYKTENEAHDAYRKKAIEIYGDDACLI